MTENDSPSPISGGPLDASKLLCRIGEELAFVTPGSDHGLLPINHFLLDLEEIRGAEIAEGWTVGLRVARGWIDEILDGSGNFSEESIRRFNEWHGFMSSVMDSGAGGRRLPAWPSDWGEPGTMVEECPAIEPASAPAGTVSDGNEPSFCLNLDEDLELLNEFHSESLELLQTIEQGVLVLESNPTDIETVNSIFRAFHTFKGGAGFLHLDPPRNLAHELETVLDLVRRSELHIGSGIINLILAGGDALEQFTRAIGAQLQGIDPGSPIVVPTSEIIRRAKAAA